MNKATKLPKRALTLTIGAIGAVLDYIGRHRNIVGFALSCALSAGAALAILWTIYEAIQYRTLGWGLAVAGSVVAGIAVLFLLVPINNWASEGTHRL